VLADGLKVAVERIGPEAEPYAIHVEGEEVPMHDPRYTPDLATTYILDATPGRHTQGGELIKPPDLDVPDYDKYDYGSPVRATAHRAIVNINHVTNAAGVCMFGVSTFGYKVLFDQLRAVTGWSDLTDEELMRTGERIATIRHAFNLREGRNPLRRHIAGRIVGRPPVRTGPVEGVVVDYARQIGRYLALIGWDPKTTVPGPKALQALGLEFLIPDLAQANVPPAELA
jgi:aldehyde:ferredoxin oxidoreductase